MSLFWESDGISIYCADALDWAEAYDGAPFHAVFCDPPYGLGNEPDMTEVLTHWLAGDDYKARGGGFMGKRWDACVPGPATWRAIRKHVHPAGYGLAFGGTFLGMVRKDNIVNNDMSEDMSGVVKQDGKINMIQINDAKTDKAFGIPIGKGVKRMLEVLNTWKKMIKIRQTTINARKGKIHFMRLPTGMSNIPAVT